MENSIVELKIRTMIHEINNSIGGLDIGGDQEMVINSIEFIKLVVEIEKEFGFEFGDEYLSGAGLETVNKIMTFIQKKIAE